MDAIFTDIIEHEGDTYRLTITPDTDSPHPLEDWEEMGTILSFNRRHVHFDPNGIEAAMETNPDAVPLSYYEHGLCHWSVAGELPAPLSCRWDSVRFAGVWLPDAATLTSAQPYGGFTRRMFMRKRAREACEVYTQWCNGDVYAYEVARVTDCPLCGVSQHETLDACGGIYGLEDCLSQARAVLRAIIVPVAPSPSPPGG